MVSARRAEASTHIQGSQEHESCYLLYLGVVPLSYPTELRPRRPDCGDSWEQMGRNPAGRRLFGRVQSGFGKVLGNRSDQDGL